MKMITDLNKLAKEIIEQNQYVTLATSDNAGNPWVSPVVYAYDKDCNFYFVSIPNSKHCLKKRLYRFYKITPSRIWMNDPNSEIDVRVGVSLKLGL